MFFPISSILYFTDHFIISQ